MRAKTEVKKYDPDRNHRRSIRLKEYNYSQVGAYFVTICIQNRELLLDDIGIRLMVQKWWHALPEKFTHIRNDQFVIMPNHIHGIIFIASVGADQRVCPDHSPQRKPTLGTIVQWFKTMTTNDYIKAVRMNNVGPFPGKLWQRNYYEHIIRDETDLNSIRQYIIDNPGKWEEDEENPKMRAITSDCPYKPAEHTRRGRPACLPR